MSIAGIDSVAHRRHALLNLLHTWLLVGGALLLFVACAYVFFGPGGIAYALVFGAVSLFVASRVSPKLVLRMYNAAPVRREHFPAGHAILDELMRRAELTARPELCVLPSATLNAFAVGRRDNSALCLTDTLIRALTRRELAAVMAHEITHIANEDVKVMAIADMVSRFTSVMSVLGILTLLLNLPGMFSGAGGIPWLGIGLLVAAPTLGGIVQMALSRAREYDADLGAVMLTGDPDGLASALAKLDAAQRRHWEGMVLPGGRMPDPSLLRSHPVTADRIARLMALKRRDLPAEPAVAAGGSRPVPAPSVPSIRPRWGRGEEQRYDDFSSLLAARAIVPVVAAETADSTCCDGPLNPPLGQPRLRLGGVYW